MLKRELVPKREDGGSQPEWSLGEQRRGKYKNWKIHLRNRKVGDDVILLIGTLFGIKN